MTAEPSSNAAPSEEAVTESSPDERLGEGQAGALEAPSEADKDSTDEGNDVASHETPDVLRGELGGPPRSPWVTALLAVTGVLLVRGGAALVGRYALGLRRPATVRMTDKGLELSHRVELLGRTVRESETVFPAENLVSVAREVRFALAGTYAGLAALVLGTYLGVTLLVDGARAPGGSPTLLGLGLALVLGGLVVDFGLSTLLDSSRRRVRLVVRLRRGRPVCITGLDEARTDALLRRVADVEPNDRRG